MLTYKEHFPLLNQQVHYVIQDKSSMKWDLRGKKMCLYSELKNGGVHTRKQWRQLVSSDKRDPASSVGPTEHKARHSTLPTQLPDYRFLSWLSNYLYISISGCLPTSWPWAFGKPSRKPKTTPLANTLTGRSLLAVHHHTAL